MFDTIEIAKRIKQARIDKNMTQLQLADAMGVSYQAVSNWERGNSMPDISKLEDLCNALNLSVNQLLGMEQAQTVSRAIQEEEPLSAEELADVAPMLPPDQVKKKTEGSRKKKKLDLYALTGLAPFLEKEYLDELVMEAAEDGNLDGLEELAPFISETTLEKLTQAAVKEDFEILVEIAPFLREKAKDQLVKRCLEAGDFESVAELAVFLSRQTLDMVADWCLANGQTEELEELYFIFSKETLKKIARHLMEQRDLDGLEGIMPFVT